MISIRHTFYKAALMAGFACFLLAPQAAADDCIFDDLIVDGSACVGFDCGCNTESFGLDTLRLKEDNLRIHFQDTSSTDSFPSNDWRIRINDSSDGGAEYYAVEDATAGRTPFRIEAGAIDNALYVDSDGDVGIGTSTPVVELHAVDGNTPTLRLEQDGSSGFTSQTFDVAGNEAGFFIRDVTNGSTLPFRIIPGASSEALVIDDDDDIGMSAGTNPTAALHVKRTDGSAQILIEEANTGALFRNLLKLDGGGLQTVVELNNSDTTVWEFAVKGTTSRFEINKQASGNPFQFLANGDLTIGGDYFSNTCVSGMPCAPDYVFESGYELMPLAELEAFVEREKHLPGIASADDIQANGLNISQMQLKLLEKVEELTLHTISQQKTIEELKARVAALEGAEE